MSTCCNAAFTPYTTFNTGITLEEMASIEPKILRVRLRFGEYQFKQTAAHGLLCNSNYLHERSGTSDKQFSLYIEAAQDLLSEKGHDIDIAANTYTSYGDDCLPCEACNTVGLMLHKAGISPQQWQDHLEERFG